MKTLRYQQFSPSLNNPIAEQQLIDFVNNNNILQTDVISIIKDGNDYVLFYYK